MQISLNQLYQAYRKAKHEAFREQTHFHSLAFAKFEARLERNLLEIQTRLANEDWFNDPSFLGASSCLPKSLEAPEAPEKREVHYATLDPLSDWEANWKRAGKQAKASFRQVIVPTVQFQIVSALWVLTAGEKFDRALDRDLAFAHRLRRIGARGPVAEEAHRLFEPYMGGYRDWRNRGLQSMKSSLANGKAIVAVTMDVRRFYHLASPNFLLRQSFLKRNLIALDSNDKKFTEALVTAINVWYGQTPDFKSRREGALPIGLTASRVISNVLLAEFDREISRNLSPVYYGRYADDIILVVERPEGVGSGVKFIEWLRKSMKGMLVRDEDGAGLRLKLPYASDSDLVFAGDKQKIFFLSGEHGIDLVDQIVEKIKDQSSEYRRLPVLPIDEARMAGVALLASPNATLEADALRKAEAVSIRRLGFSMMLSAVSQYAADLDPDQWRPLRVKFYGLVMRYVMTPTGYFDYFTYIVRTFGLMVACRDFAKANELLDQFNKVRALIAKTSDARTRHGQQFEATRMHYRKGFLQEAIAASTLDGFSHSATYRSLLKRLGAGQGLFSPRGARRVSKSLLLADLGRRPYWEHWTSGGSGMELAPRLPKFKTVRKVRLLLEHFKRRSITNKGKPYWPAVAFPTRPVPIPALSLAVPELLALPGGLEAAIDVTRGSQVNPGYRNHVFASADESRRLVFDVPWTRSSSRVCGLPSYGTSDAEYAAAAQGSGSKTLDRYVRFRRLVNRVLADSPSVDYLAFPEASIPMGWALSAAEKLGYRGVSLIAGVENRAVGSRYTNEALVSLATNYFGSRGSICFVQPKMAPAHIEAEMCRDLSKTFVAGDLCLARPVYMHGGLFFGVLICSDFTDVAHRAYFQGAIDALFVLEWNRDIGTFEFLVESAAHDLHGAIVQVNNRTYGDSRIRIPFADDYRRDVVRVKGGDEDFYVVASIDFAALRAFQRKPIKKGFYKPIPIGFKMSPAREHATDF